MAKRASRGAEHGRVVVVRTDGVPRNREGTCLSREAQAGALALLPPVACREGLAQKQSQQLSCSVGVGLVAGDKFAVDVGLGDADQAVGELIEVGR
jgi:hypothetical protein